MKLLPEIKLQAGHRIIWLNEEARENWNAAINEINTEVQRTELISVVKDQRPCGTMTTSPVDLISIASRYPELVFEPLQAVKKYEGFAHRFADPQPGDEYFIYYAFGKSRDAIKSFRAAFEANDHIAIGMLLGFPPCCGRFFETSWNKDFIDPIWQAALNTKLQEVMDAQPETKTFDPTPIIAEYEEARAITIEPHPYSNPLLRYIGARAGFHIPHSFRCKESIEAGTERMKLLPIRIKDLCDALLSMPMEWNVLHGIAEIRTPIFWIVTSSVWTKYNYKVKTLGQFIPKETRDDT